MIKKLFLFCFLLTACSDFLEPVKKSSDVSDYEFHYWLLSKTYLFQEDLKNIPTEGESILSIYNNLRDPFTRYYPPQISKDVESKMNTSIVEGDLGLEYLNIYTEDNGHPIIISRVYEDSPSGKAHVPRYGIIIRANGVELVGQFAKIIYDSIVDYSSEIALDILHKDSLYHFNLKKETVYAPTIFLDTISGVTFINIREFKGSTVDRKNGTFGELKSYLDSTTQIKAPRVLDLRNNPGGLINQCIPAADLFIKEGLISKRKYVTLSPDGSRSVGETNFTATLGDSGENGHFIILANGNSASCAEIFIAALKEQEKILFVGQNTFGKGIGQSQWKTKEGGFSVITSLEFVSPKGISYHKQGITPDIECTEGATRACALEAINAMTDSTTLSFENKIDKFLMLQDDSESLKADYFEGGALDTTINFVDFNKIF